MATENSRLVPEHQAQRLEIEAKRHWDLFYERNENRFFKDRHWTTCEFQKLLGDVNSCEKQILLEIGCGAGNLVYPLVAEHRNFFVYACNFSPRTVELVKTNHLYNEQYMQAFETDIITGDIHCVIRECSVDIVTLIFVISAIQPDKFVAVMSNVLRVLKPGGVVLFRDYGLHDMAQIRFKPGHKIAENFYMRQDGTRSYYFSRHELARLFSTAGFQVITNEHIHRRIINKKEDINVLRIFVQAKVQKPSTNDAS